MTVDEYKKHAFVIVASKIAGSVQHACLLAGSLPDPTAGFDYIHVILNACITEISLREAALRTELTPIPEDTKDGN